MYVTSKLISEAVNCVPGPAIYNVVTAFQTNVSRLVSGFSAEKARKEVEAAASARKAAKISQQASKAAERASAVGGHADKVLRAQVKDDLEDAKRLARIQFLKKANEEDAVAASKMQSQSEDSLIDDVDAQLLESSIPAQSSYRQQQQQQQEDVTLWKREYTARTLSADAKAKQSEKSLKLREQFMETQNTNKKYQSMQNQRRKLPSYEMRDQVMDTILANQVVLISGATGCGKTTQVGQFILDDMVSRGRGAECNIICTQPRRLAATGVAARVADERAEKLGSTVGYSIRLETVRSEETRLLFVTTGVLLRRLQSDAWLEGISHLILDEVHERDLNSDFLLIILRELVKKRTDIKLILMSATLNADVFADYFGNCPVLNIPGRTFPVQEFYLEDALNQSDYVLAENSPYAKQGKTGPPQQSLAKKFAQFPPRVIKALENMDHKKINYELIEKLVVYICDAYKNDDGAILIFLPGLAEISTLLDLLQNSGDLRRRVGTSARLRILPLHSSLSTEQQQQIFERPPSGVRKIILSTNIAETSITVDGPFPFERLFLRFLT